MAKAKQTPQQLLETARGEMSKDEFAAALGISRQWYHQVLTGAKEIDLKTLCWLAVDYQDDWRGKLANELIVIWHGEEYVPVGSREELVNLREFLLEVDYEDMSTLRPQLHKNHFGLWAAELRDRLEKQLVQIRESMKAEVPA
jgi:transcriptional regulator with XRE-family HTH domain